MCMNIFPPCQGVLPPVLMAQFSNNWEILELLTEKYGCTIDVSVLSQVVLSVGNIYCFVIHDIVPYLHVCSKDKSRHKSTKCRLEPFFHITCVIANHFDLHLTKGRDKKHSISSCFQKDGKTFMNL